METNADGSSTACYVYGIGLIAKYDVESSSDEDSKSEEEPENRSTDVHYYHYDSRGSTILLTNAVGDYRLYYI